MKRTEKASLTRQKELVTRGVPEAKKKVSPQERSDQ